MRIFGRNICFLGAHPDDIELGCGALIAQIVGECNILCVTLSDNQKNPKLHNLVNEHYNSMGVLGVNRRDIVLEEFETRKFPACRQEILEFLFKINKTFTPDIVFTHTRSDIHQDHVTTTEEALRAFRGTTVLGYDVLRSSYGFFPHFLIGVSEAEVEKKVNALTEYKTYSGKYYFSPDVTRATMKRHGALAEREFAEGFDIIRIVASFGK